MSIFEERRSDILRRMLADSVPGPLNMELPLLRFELDGDAGVANRELRKAGGSRRLAKLPAKGACRSPRLLNL